MSKSTLLNSHTTEQGRVNAANAFLQKPIHIEGSVYMLYKMVCVNVHKVMFCRS